MSCLASRAQRQGVEVFHQPEQRADAPRLQAHQRFVELHVRRQDLLEIGPRHAQDRAVAMRIRIVRASVPVEHRHVAEPDARLHVGQRHLLARHRRRTDAHRAPGAGDPVFGRVAAGGDQVAVLEAFDECASEDVVPQRWRKGRKPATTVDRFTFFDGKNGVVHWSVLSATGKLVGVTGATPRGATRTAAASSRGRPRCRCPRSRGGGCARSGRAPA